MVSVVEGVLVSEGEGDDGDSGDSVDWDICDWDSCVDEDSAKEGSVDEDLGGGFSGVGVDGEGWIIADVTGVDTVDVSVEKDRTHGTRNHYNKPTSTILKYLS